MGKEEFYGYMSKYFALSELEVKKMLDEKFAHKAYEQKRLIALIETTVPYFEKFVDNADEKLKRKVGKVFLSKLDYSQFYEKETLAEMSRRLDNLFTQTTAKGINIYKILYCQVLTDGNLKREQEHDYKFYSNSRDFNSIYESLCDTLNLTNEQANEIFEKCSTLIAKGYAYKFPHVYNKLRELAVYDESGSICVFKANEVVDILKINPSLFVLSTDRIQDAYAYVSKKMKSIWKEEAVKAIEENPNLSTLIYQTIQMRKCLKNNSSLLTLNSDMMYKKEVALKNVSDIKKGVYFQSFKPLFRNPSNLAIINQIPVEKISKNCLENIKTLEGVAHQDAVGQYILKNQYMIGMDHVKFKNLVESIVALDSEFPEEKYLHKFFQSGRTLFASNIDFEPNMILEKLKNNQVMLDLGVSQLSDKECLHKFVGLFFEGDYQLETHINELIQAKKERDQNGERHIRKVIRWVGRNIMDLPIMLKDDNISTNHKKETLNKIASDIEGVHNKRFVLTGVSKEDNEIRAKEIRDSRLIEHDINLLRETYEQKRFKLSKNHVGVEELFERVMDYLSQSFDDKEAITDLFRKEIADNFTEAIKMTYETNSSIQGQLFGETLEVKDADPKLLPELKKVNKQINRIDGDGNSVRFDFDK